MDSTSTNNVASLLSGGNSLPSTAISPNFVQPYEIVSSQIFGADLLGFDTNNHGLFEAAGEIGITNVRWPGEIIADAQTPIWFDNNQTPSNPSDDFYSYDLAHDGVMIRSGNSGKDNLYDVLSDIATSDDITGLTMLVPTLRYISISLDGGTVSFSINLGGALNDINGFLLKLVDTGPNGYGGAPENFTLQLGQEYYNSLNPFMQTLEQYLEGGLIDINQAITANEAYLTTLANVYSLIIEQIATTSDEIEGFNPSVAVHMGRFHVESHNPFIGSFNDAQIFAEAMSTDALESIDTLLWQRYLASYNSINDGLSESSAGHGLEETVAVWKEQAALRGLLDKHFNVFVGYGTGTINNNISDTR